MAGKKEASRATRELTIQFGQVPVAVRLYKATDEKLVRQSHRYHKVDMAPVKNVPTCEACKAILPWSDIVNGYELDGKVISMTKDEIKQLKPRSTETMTIKGYIDVKEIDPLLWGDSVYYVGTGKKTTGAPFVLLRDSLRESGKVAVVQWVNGHEQLGVLMPHGKALLLREVFYEDQIRSTDFDVVEGSVSPELLAKGVQKVRDGAKPFDHSEYEEHFSKELDAILFAKADGKEVKVESVTVKSEEEELMALMEGN